MREIYKLACPEKEDSSAALSFIKQTRDIQVRDAGVTSTKFFWWGAGEMANLEEEIKTGVSLSNWKAVTQLFKSLTE
jgi:hypothetical protein